MTEQIPETQTIAAAEVAISSGLLGNSETGQLGRETSRSSETGQ